MNRITKILIAILIILFAIKVGPILADQGWELAMRLERGRNETPTQITVTNSATSIVSASTKRPDITCFNNSSSTMWIGGDNTVTAANGFPVVSSATFKDDSFIGPIFGICDAASCDVRCWAGTVP